MNRSVLQHSPITRVLYEDAFFGRGGSSRCRKKKTPGQTDHGTTPIHLPLLHSCPDGVGRRGLAWGLVKGNDGASGIRTHGTRLTYTRFPSVRLRPLGHRSKLTQYTEPAQRSSVPKRIRTSDLQFRKLVLYPAKLWAQYGEGGIRTLGTLTSTTP
jgi:hypothetical protein